MEVDVENGSYQLQGKTVLTQRQTLSTDTTSGKEGCVSKPCVKIMFLSHG